MPISIFNTKLFLLVCPNTPPEGGCRTTDEGLKGRVVIIAGGSNAAGGILAELIAKEGATVVLVDGDPAGSGVASKIQGLGGKIEFVQCDPGSAIHVEGVVPLIMARYGNLDILINNFSAIPVKSWAEMEMPELEAILQVNFKTPVQLSRKAINAMISKKKGVVVNLIPSVPALVEKGDAFIGAMSSSGAALSAFTSSLANEVEAYGISVMGFTTGMVKSPSTEQSLSVLAQRSGRKIEELRKILVLPESVAEGVMMLLSQPEDFHGGIFEIEPPVEEGKVEEIANEPMAAEAKPVKAEKPAPLIDVLGDSIAKSQARSKESAIAMREMQVMFNHLPVYVQPIARDDFQRTVGDTVENVKAGVDQIHLWLNNIAAAYKRKDASSLSVQGGKVIATHALRQEQLQKLAAFIKQSSDDAGKYLKDDAEVAAYREKAANYQVSVQGLHDDLERMQQEMLKYLGKIVKM